MKKNYPVDKKHTTSHLSRTGKSSVFFNVFNLLEVSNVRLDIMIDSNVARESAASNPQKNDHGLRRAIEGPFSPMIIFCWMPE